MTNTATEKAEVEPIINTRLIGLTSGISAEVKHCKPFTRKHPTLFLSHYSVVIS